MKNVGVNHKSFDRIGFKCWLGKCLVIRRVVMNLINYSRGGEGRAPIEAPID